MNATPPSKVNAGGVITVTNENGGHRTLTVPPAGSDQKLKLDLAGFETRQIHMIGIPSATIITWFSKNWEDGKADWEFTLKTTHAPSALTTGDIHAYVNRHEKGDFIRTGLGILVTGKKGTAEKDTLGSIIVETSAPSRLPTGDSPAAAPDHGEQP